MRFAVSWWVQGEVWGLVGEALATAWRSGTPSGGDAGVAVIGCGDGEGSLGDSCALGLGFSGSVVGDDGDGDS